MNWLSASLWFVIFAKMAYAQALPPGMIMHRTQAGTLDKSGWTSAESTQGAFKVSLPCKFNDFTVEEKDPTSPTEKTFTVGCLRTDRSKFSATRVQYRQATAAKTFFDKNSSATSGPGEVQGAGRHAGLPFVDRALRDSTQCGFMRFISAPPDNLVMIVEAPASACTGLDSMKERFFRSLAVEKR